MEEKELSKEAKITQALFEAQMKQRSLDVNNQDLPTGFFGWWAKPRYKVAAIFGTILLIILVIRILYLLNG